MSDWRAELVMGLPRERALAAGGWRGVLATGVDEYIGRIRAEAAFRPRADVENDPSWKQVIPYVVVRDGGRLFLLRRTRAGSDARLHERWSIGIGGHVSQGDGSMEAGLLREWHEELVAAWDPEPRLVGLLNDDSDPVGAVHLGVVFTVEAAGRPLRVRETDKLDGAFVALLDVLRVHDRLETWSSLLYDYLTERAPAARAAGVPSRD
jgi:predicted NUDIX family phosphoesterase